MRGSTSTRCRTGWCGLLVALLFATPASGQAHRDMSPNSGLREQVIGSHILTLQWLDNEGRGNSGCATITGVGEDLSIEGSVWEARGDRTNLVSLEGTVRILDARTLEFVGTIHSEIDFINGGKPHTRSGTFRFKAWGNRRYWRLQEGREQPDGEYTVTDYLDIHFSRCPE